MPAVPRPRARAVGAVVLGAVIYAYGATSEVAWLFLAAYICWSITAVAFVYALAGGRGLSVSTRLAAVRPGALSPAAFLPDAVLLRGPAAPAFEGDSARVEVVIETSGGGSRGPVRVQGEVNGEKFDAGAGRVRGRLAVPVEVAGLLRGSLEAGVQAEFGDPAGFWRVPLGATRGAVAAVMPLFAGGEEPARPLEMEVAAASPRAGAGLEVIGVREYRPGDSLRRVHWRTSARRGQLVVREFEPPGRRLTLVALDAAPPAEASDQMARLAATEAWARIAAGGSVALWAGGAGLPPQTSIWPVLEWLAAYPAAPRQDGPPVRAAEVIALSAGADPEVLEVAHAAARRGAEARAWLVGQGAPPEAGIPARRTGLEWPP